MNKLVQMLDLLLEISPSVCGFCLVAWMQTLSNGDDTETFGRFGLLRENNHLDVYGKALTRGQPSGL